MVQDMVQDMVVQADQIGFNVHTSASRRHFWRRVSEGSWEPQTFRVLQRFLRSDCSYLDLGAWIGPTVLYGAQLARRVHALEPDPVAFSELEANVHANPQLHDRIRLYPFGVAPHTGSFQLYAGGLYHGEQSQFGDSMSGMLAAPGLSGQPSHEASGVELKGFMEQHAIKDCNFIKMDIEGGEYAVIPGLWHTLQRFGQPTLCVSFHAPELARREPLICDCLEELLSCFPRFYSAMNQQQLDIEQMLQAVKDWGDEAKGSPWRTLETLLGAGLVATAEEW